MLRNFVQVTSFVECWDKTIELNLQLKLIYVQAHALRWDESFHHATIFLEFNPYLTGSFKKMHNEYISRQTLYVPIT